MLLPTALGYVTAHGDRMHVRAETLIGQSGMVRVLTAAGICSGDPADLNLEVRVGRACPSLRITLGDVIVAGTLLAPTG